MKQCRMKLRLSKKGSYITEAAIILPIFIVAVLIMISAVPRMARCERLVFTVCDEMAKENIYAHFFKSYIRCQSHIREGAERALGESDSFRVDSLKYCYRDRIRAGRTTVTVDDVITVDFTAMLKYNDPLSMGDDIVFSGRFKCRPFTGSVRQSEAMSRDEMERDEDSEPVYVFPDWGERYHKRDCSVLNPAFEMTSLSQQVRKRYRACDICSSGDKSIGTTVFLFRRAGEVYHTGDCSTVEKYFIEIDKDEAEGKGYTPCMKCGG